MLSAVAGIIDREGGLRVVVTQQWRMRYHLAEGERLFIVPNLMVEEPVPWDEIPWMISQVNIHIHNWIKTRNDPDNLRHPAIAKYIARPDTFKGFKKRPR